MTLDDLLAREGIRDLVCRYNSYGDSGRFDQLFELMTHDVVIEITSAIGEPEIHTGIERVKQIFTGAQGRVQTGSGQRDAEVAPTYIRHFTATHQIDLVDEDHARGRCYFAVIVGNATEAKGLDHWGRYVDDYVRVDGEWRFQHRRVHVDGQLPGSWFASPEI